MDGDDAKKRPFSLFALHLSREEADGLGVIAVDGHRIVALTTRNIIQPGRRRFLVQRLGDACGETAGCLALGDERVGYPLYPVRKNGDCTRSRQPSWLDCDVSSRQLTSAVMFMSK